MSSSIFPEIDKKIGMALSDYYHLTPNVDFLPSSEEIAKRLSVFDEKEVLDED